jgi:hypothetical protein
LSKRKNIVFFVVWFNMNIFELVSDWNGCLIGSAACERVAVIFVVLSVSGECIPRITLCFSWITWMRLPSAEC